MGSSATRAKDLYNQKSYERIYIRVPMGEKKKWGRAAAKRGLSLNSLVNDAVDTFIRGDKK